MILNNRVVKIKKGQGLGINFKYLNSNLISYPEYCFIVYEKLG